MLHRFKSGAVRGLFPIIVLAVLFCSAACAAENHNVTKDELMPYSEREAVFNAINAKIESMVGKSQKEFALEMAEFLRGLNAFKEIHIADDYETTSAIFKDGTTLVVPNRSNKKL